MSEDTPKRKPVNYDELFPGRFLKAGLFIGKTPTFAIADVDTEDLPQDDGKNKVRGIITFRETKMGLALNSTNGQSIKAMFGPKIADWIGKRLTLCTEKDRDPGGNGMVDCIRIAGSPDIERDVTIEIKMPRRKPKMRKLTKTLPKGAPKAAQQPPEEAPAMREPGEEP
jgi:hypothetical protein